MIKTVGLTKRYKDIIAVDGLDLEISKGELFSLLGVNGAGKSTTIKMLCCQTKPTGGDAFVCGNSIISGQQVIKGLIGVSPQETAVAANLTVKENLVFMCGIYGMTKDQTQGRINRIVKQLELQHILNRQAGKLSGGWQRRLSIAMALISDPQVLILDEPTLGLDVIARRKLWDVILKLKGKVTILLTTHYMEEAEALSDRIGIMKDGRLRSVGTAKELMAQTGTEKFENAFISLVMEASI